MTMAKINLSSIFLMALGWPVARCGKSGAQALGPKAARP